MLYHLHHEILRLFHDELDLAPAKVRVKTGGGHGGNNGIRDLTAHIGADFKRVRIGVGHPGNKDAVSNHVLSDFAKADKAWIEPFMDEAVRALPHLMADQDDKFMTQVAQTIQKSQKG